MRDVANKTVTVVDHVKYDSFGRILYESSPTNGDRFKYTAREYDSATGLYYYRARYYDPTTGRFIAQDPIGFEAGDENIYRYVANQPTISTDPTGLAGRPQWNFLYTPEYFSRRVPVPLAVYDWDKDKPYLFRMAADDYPYHYHARSLQQIVNALNVHYANYPNTNVQDLYIFAHGTNGSLALGGYRVDRNDPLWRQIGERIHGEIYIVACQVGRDPSYIEAVAGQSGRTAVGYTWDIAAGNRLGYDWWFQEVIGVEFEEVRKSPPKPPDPLNGSGGGGP